MESDFSLLYSQLNLPPDCTLEELQQAYRRRVAELHPDRHNGAPAGEAAEQQLAGLILLYKTALRFHRLHGRLPGGITRAAISNRRKNTTPPQRENVAGSQVPPAAGRDIRTPSLSWWLVATLSIVVFYLLLSTSDDVPSADSPSTAGRDSADTASVDGVRPRHLALGMSMVTVLEVQGPPTHMESTVWEYGPSWVRFEDGKLVEWHSSPLRRLKTPQPRPGEN
jgi:hypothetical protein